MVINHLGETTDMVVRHIKALSGYAFQTADQYIFGIGGPASAAMEMAMGNLLWPGRSVLVLKCGSFSGRFAEMATGVGADVDILSVDDGLVVTAEQVAERLKERSYDVVTMVQGETSKRSLHNGVARDYATVQVTRGFGRRRCRVHIEHDAFAKG